MPSLPKWLRKKVSRGHNIHQLKTLLRSLNLHTVCESARCPNIGECFGRGVATFMILGNVCTRKCRFCNVESGVPLPIDPNEPRRVADAAKALGLKFAVITSVTRDDLHDGGASHFAKTISALKEKRIEAEVLVPDFMGNEQAVGAIVESNPAVFAHNLETVERLYSEIRPQASFKRSLRILSLVKRLNPQILVKSSLIIGLGETESEIISAMKATRDTGCDIITIGQYLQPNRSCTPVKKYWPPEFFTKLSEIAQEIGFKKALCGPYVRSSYLAETLISV